MDIQKKISESINRITSKYTNELKGKEMKDNTENMEDAIAYAKKVKEILDFLDAVLSTAQKEELKKCYSRTNEKLKRFAREIGSITG